MDKATKIICDQNWADIFRECSASGLSKTQFCRERGIPVKSFFYYQRICSTKKIISLKNQLCFILCVADTLEPYKRFESSNCFDNIMFDFCPDAGYVKVQIIRTDMKPETLIKYRRDFVLMKDCLSILVESDTNDANKLTIMPLLG